MRPIRLAMWVTLTTQLAAQGNDQGFTWVGLRAGSLSFDSQDNAKASTFFGGQAGMVFDQKQYGFSFEGISSHPRSNLYPGKTFNHKEFSATLLRGLSADSQSSSLWPYFGVGLGSITVAQDNPATQAVATNTCAMAHAAFGLLHRPVPNLVWGIEGRWLVTITAVQSRDRQDFQGSLLVGFSWGGPKEPRRSSPPPAAKLPPPPAVKEPLTPTPALPIPSTPTTGVPIPRPATPPTPAPAPQAVTLPTPAPALRAVTPTTPAPAPRAVTPLAAPAPAQSRAPAPPVSPAPSAGNIPVGDSALLQGLEALRTGDTVKALELGRKRMEAMPRNHWTLRLEIADLPSTLKAAVGAFPGRNPDLFIAPIQLRVGQISYQLFLGAYATKAEAERAAKSVPAFFLEGGQRPRPFLVSAIPARGNR